MLLLGDKGDRVAALQRALKITADGSFGPATLKAVLAWQKLKCLPEHGFADELTLKSLGLD